MIERKSPFGVLEFDQWGFSIFGLGVHNYEQLRQLSMLDNTIFFLVILRELVLLSGRNSMAE